MAGSYAGTRLSSGVPPGLLLSLFAALMLAAARRVHRRRAGGALAGNRVAFRIDASRLTTAFTILLVAVAAHSLARSLPGLL